MQMRGIVQADSKKPVCLPDVWELFPWNSKTIPKRLETVFKSAQIWAKCIFANFLQIGKNEQRCSFEVFD